MASLAVLVPLSLVMGIIGLGVFFWCMRDGQYDDLDGAAERILLDDETGPEQERELSRRRDW